MLATPTDQMNKGGFVTDTKVVPLEPTGAMLGLIAGEGTNDPPLLTRDQALIVYRAVLAAAPSLSGKPEEGETGKIVVDYEAAARKAVDRILRDLEERKGIGDEWEGLDDDLQHEIKSEWQALVFGAIQSLREAALSHSEHSTGGVDARQPQAPGADQWIPCSERLPENSNRVLAWHYDEATPAYCWVWPSHKEWQHGHWYYDDFNGYPVEITITHWMPLPAPPSPATRESSGTHHRYGEQTRNEALEEAARECDARAESAKKGYGASSVSDYVIEQVEATNCANAIRSLKSGVEDEKR